MISTRYTASILLLLVVALVPTVLHSYLGRVQDDGRKVASVPETLAGMTSVTTGRNPTWGRRRFDSHDWIERAYTSGQGETLTLFVGRSYDAKKLYHHPELSVAYGTHYRPSRVIRLSDLPGVPVHVLRGDRSDPSAVGLYVLHYGDTFVERPLVFQIGLVGRQMLAGPQPMTLFFVRADEPRETLDGTPAARLLAAAVDRFVTQAGEGAASRASGSRP